MPSVNSYLDQFVRQICGGQFQTDTKGGGEGDKAEAVDECLARGKKITSRRHWIYAKRATLDEAHSRNIEHPNTY